MCPRHTILTYSVKIIEISNANPIPDQKQNHGVLVSVHVWISAIQLLCWISTWPLAIGEHVCMITLSKVYTFIAWRILAVCFNVATLRCSTPRCALQGKRGVEWREKMPLTNTMRMIKAFC